jgi:uncharacterized membrane protein
MMPFAEQFERWSNIAAQGFEVAGVVAVVVGGVASLLLAILPRAAGGATGGVREFRKQFGNAIVLGLEIMVAADILRTISATPTEREVIVLASIVLIRTFVSWSLEVELDGRWPWKRNAP